ncbi:MAG: GNAT family N-acetyltransferase [Candidatus Diapherotrites archaeon]|nr:GNAT family N-acetyltransferase [Candidatus Diapherotrites archaeon]
MEIKEFSLSDSLGDIVSLGGKFIDHSYSKEKVQQRLQGKNFHIYFAVENENKVGLCIWFPEGKEAYWWLLCVDASFRRKGIGKVLSQFLEKQIKHAGFSVITAKTHTKRSAMIELFKKLGYTEVGREKGHWGDEREAIFYEKKI